MILFQVTLTATALGVAPARDETLGTSSCTISWQRDSGYLSVESGRLAQFNQHDVVIQGSFVETGMDDDLGCTDELLIALKDINVVCSQTHLHSAGLKGYKFSKTPTST